MRTGKTKDEREQKAATKPRATNIRFVSLLHLIALVIEASLIYGTNQRAQMSDKNRLRENERNLKLK